VTIENTTIAEVLDKALESSPNYDEEFATEFNDILSQACADRTALGAAESGERQFAAQQYVNSWSAVVSLFAEDPISLAALTAPRIEMENLACPNPVEDLFTCVTTPTMAPFLYDAAIEQEQAAQVKLEAPAKKTRLKQKPTKKSKKQINAKPKSTGKAKPKAKSKPKTTAKKAKKARRR
jgi:hypothetical protein